MFKRNSGGVKMDADAYQVHESDCNTINYANEQNALRPNRDFVDDATYYYCIGNEIS